VSNKPSRVEVYAVIRIDIPDGFSVSEQNMPQIITVKEIVLSLADATSEVARLNQLNSDKGCFYFWQTTRLSET